jgi:plasmid stabilization system protein ParE
MRQYYLSPEAEQDINDAITYLAAENLSAADQFLESLFS